MFGFKLLLLVSSANQASNCRSVRSEALATLVSMDENLSVPLRSKNPRSSLIVPLKLKTYQHLQPSRRPRADRMSKKRRAQIAHWSAEVNVIENVKRVHRYGSARARVLRLPMCLSFGRDQPKCLGKAKIERRGPWSFQAVSRDAGPPGIGKRGPVIVRSGCHGVGLPRADRQRCADADTLRCGEGAVEIKKVQSVEVGPRPLTAQIILIRGKRRDSGSIIIRSAQRVLGHSVEKMADFCTHGQLQGVARQVPRRFDLPKSTDLRIRALNIERRKGSIEVARPEQIESAHPDVGGREGRRFL